MFSQLVPINKEAHARKKLLSLKNFSYAESFHLASVMVPEFGRAAASYPIVFLQDKEQDGFRPVAMLGVDEGINLMVDAEGNWPKGYIPAIIRRYPFSLIKLEPQASAEGNTEDQFLVGIDATDTTLGDENSEGAALFTDEGSPAEILLTAQQFLGELQQMEKLTLEFSKFLASHNMLTPLNLQVQDGSGLRNIAGAYVINEERLTGLSDETFNTMRKLGYLPAIYAHLLSLFQIDRLLSLKAERMAGASDATASKGGAKNASKETA